jgi:hypothetical protein
MTIFAATAQGAAIFGFISQKVCAAVVVNDSKLTACSFMHVGPGFGRPSRL